MSTLTLVGAGPGDPELITLKAINALKKADVVLYDALASEDLLSYCKNSCEKVFVGKKPGIHEFQQIYINDMIIDYGKCHQHIVRLKGGDPFVFGRGYEELTHARAHGMQVEVVPGISSSIAVPATCEIPLTHRGVNDSFWVITGTTRTLDLSNDILLAAKSSATVVILMGMRHLDRIIEIFTQHRGEDAAIGIIQNGTRANQKSATGKLSNIGQLVKEQELSSPAIIVIGEVVKLGKEKVQQAIEQQNILVEQEVT